MRTGVGRPQSQGASTIDVTVVRADKVRIGVDSAVSLYVILIADLARVGEPIGNGVDIFLGGPFCTTFWPNN